MNNSFRIISFLFCITFIACGGSEVKEHVQTLPQESRNKDIETINLAIEENPNSGDLYYQRGKLYYGLEIYEEATKDLHKAVVLDSSLVPAWHLLADSYLDNNRSRPAIETMEALLNVFPDGIPSLLKMSEFQMIIERYNAAHITLNKILKKDPTNAEGLFMKGLVYKYQEKPIQASSAFQQAVQSNPDMIDAYLELGELFTEAKNPLAVKYYQNVFRIDPNNIESRIGLSNYYWFNNNYLMAHEVLKNLISINPMEQRAHYNQGLIYLEQDSLNKAQGALELALKLNAADIKTHYYLGEVAEKQKNVESALIHYQNVLNLSPNHAKAREKLQILKSSK